MKRYFYLLMLSVMLFALQACGSTKTVSPAPDLKSAPGIQSNEPFDPSLLGSAVNKPAAPPSGCTASSADAASFGTEVIRLVNVERANAGLGALTSQSQLTQAAQNHAFDEGCNFFMSHTGSDGSSALDRIVRAGYAYSWWGENVAAGYDTPADVMVAWMNSPTHRDNILSPNFTEIGIGYVNNPNDTTNYWYTYWAMSLGAPQ
jgi:uncharacterized protein YkwD